MRILVTGGAGYIGSHIVRQLGEGTDHDIVVLDNLSSGHKKYVFYGAFHEIDLANTCAVEKIIQDHQIDTVIHLAAHVSVPASLKNPLACYITNVSNSINLINLCIKHKISKFIFSSSAAVYGHSENKIVTEESPLSPQNPYGYSKLIIENILKDIAEAHPDFKYISLRYFNVGGASIDGTLGQVSTCDSLLKNLAQTACGTRDCFTIYGTDYKTHDGSAIRDFIHVEDIARAHIDTLTYLDTAKSTVFNCGYGHGYSVKQVVEAMRTISDHPFKTINGASRPGDIAELISDSQKITQKTGWKPQYDDIDIICKTAYEWEKKLCG